MSQRDRTAIDVDLFDIPAHIAVDRDCLCLKKAGWDVTDLDLLEINEAFASVALWSARMLDLDPADVNPNGGAVALGHPIGCTGARIVVSLINELTRRGGGIGAAALCGGGGQGAVDSGRGRSWPSAAADRLGR